MLWAELAYTVEAGLKTTALTDKTPAMQWLLCLILTIHCYNFKNSFQPLYNSLKVWVDEKDVFVGEVMEGKSAVQSPKSMTVLTGSESGPDRLPLGWPSYMQYVSGSPLDTLWLGP